MKTEEQIRERINAFKKEAIGKDIQWKDEIMLEVHALEWVIER